MISLRSINSLLYLSVLFFLLTSCCNRHNNDSSLFGKSFSFDFEYQIILNDTILEKNDFMMTPLKLVFCKDSLGCPICLNNIITSVSNYFDRCNTFSLFEADSIGFYVIMSALPTEMQNIFFNVDIPYVYLLRDVNEDISGVNKQFKGIENDCLLLLDYDNNVIRLGDFLHDSKERKEFEKEIIRLLNTKTFKN